MFLRVQGTRRLYFQWECARKWSHDLLLLRMHLWFCLKAKKDKVSKIKHFKYHSVCHFCAFPAISEPFSCSHGYPILWNYIFIAIKYLCRILALKAISVLQWVANVFNHWIRETQRRTPQWELLLWAAVIFKFSGVVYITLFLGRFQWVMMLLNASAVFSSCQKKKFSLFWLCTIYKLPGDFILYEMLLLLLPLPQITFCFQLQEALRQNSRALFISTAVSLGELGTNSWGFV